MKINTNSSILSLLRAGYSISNVVGTIRPSTFVPRMIVVEPKNYPAKRFPFSRKGLDEALAYMQHPKGGKPE
jgi:hypothetical protein